MKVQVTKEEGLKRELTIKVPSNDVETKEQAKLQEIAKTIKISGFRPGKVPVNVVKQRHGDAVKGEVLQEIVNDCTTKALDEKKLKPAMQPNIEIKSFETGKDLEYTVNFEMIPDIELKDVDKLKLEKWVTKADKKAVDEALERIAENNKQTKTVETKRAIKKGDVVLLDFDGKVDGERRDGMKGENHELEIGSGQFIPGFEEQLIGKKAGDEVEVKVTFPDPYMSEDLAGKDAVFDVKIHEIREYDTPKVDDEFAKKLGLEDAKDLREKVQEQIEAEYENFSRNRMKRDLLDKLADEYSFDVPETLVKAEFDQIWQQVQREIEAEKARGEEPDVGDEEEMKKEYEEIAERRVRLGLLLSEIGTKNDVQVTREDLNQALISEARKYQGYERQVFEYYQNNPQAMESLKAPIFEDKVVDFIFEKADVKEKEVSLDELTADPDADKTVSKPSGKKKAASSKSTKKSTAKKSDDKKSTAKKETTKKKTASKKSK